MTEQQPLCNQTCAACRGDMPALSEVETVQLLSQLNSSWSVEDGHHLEREFEFPDFASALEFVNKIGAIAEEQAHHPDLFLAWGLVGVQIWTHKIDGLTESDFILAAKIDQISPSEQVSDNDQG